METQLIDSRNFIKLLPELLNEIKGCKKAGFDIETHDEGRHDGLNRLMKVSEEGAKSKTTKLVFDVNRTVVTGFSWYCEGSEVAYYLNLQHADEENRIPWEQAKSIVDALKKHTIIFCHNAPFELTMMRKSLGYDLGDRVICTMQLAVSAFNDDTYDFKDLVNVDLKRSLGAMLRPMQAAWRDYKPGEALTSNQEEMLFKFIAKESDASHSYNGIVKAISYGYGLKALTKKFLGYTQKTFADTLGDKVHMGQLTGEEVVSYGADDAWVCLELAHKLVEYINEKSPDVLNTFLSQENPMIHVFSDVWAEGVRVDTEAIRRARERERKAAANILRELKAAVLEVLKTAQREPHEKLAKYDKWYADGKHSKYRKKIVEWVRTPNSEDDFEQLYQVRSAISNVWAEERGMPENKHGVNLNHYMPVRTILYDLCRLSYIQYDGKTQSNGEAQATMRERWIKAHGENDGDPVLKILSCYAELAQKEQVIKLYLNNYLNLVDPETNRMYPVLDSKLNTRRMALSVPNVSQLPKGSSISYVRGFFLGDDDEHLVVSADWSSVELVLIGEQSQDLGFKEAFGQLPYRDLHAKAVMGCLGLTQEEYDSHPEKKNLRRDVGKAANFGYWYSGGLGTVGKNLGWTSEEMWEKVDGYRTTFPLAENWRLNKIEEVKRNGEVTLPDGHKRYRLEATQKWASVMRSKFAQVKLHHFGEIALKKIRARAGNQAVNADIQGTCATLAKRTISAMKKLIAEKGYRARFMFPVHDELIFSVHKDDLADFIPDFRYAMCNHPELIKFLKLDATVAIGRNYWAYHEKDNPYGQIELDEFNMKMDGIEYGSKLTDTQILKVIDYLTKGT